VKAVDSLVFGEWRKQRVNKSLRGRSQHAEVTERPSLKKSRIKSFDSGSFACQVRCCVKTDDEAIIFSPSVHDFMFYIL
jgi:hypothetical protein